MSRKFLRPLFSFWDPFFSEPIYIKRVKPANFRPSRAVEAQEKKQVYDAHQTFDNFFKEFYDNSAALRAEQKQFFQKHYPEKLAKKFNPYEVLGIQTNSDLQKVKQAYRTNALKYHPKNNSEPQAKQKFEDISRAYNQIVNQKQSNENAQDNSGKSLFEDFNREMENLGKAQSQQKGNGSEVKNESKEKSQSTMNMKAEQKKGQAPEKKGKQSKQIDKSKDNLLKGAQLYSQTSYFEYVNGKRKLHVTRMYQKNGKTIKVDRTQESRKDGSIEVSQTFDDGKQIRNKKYIQEANKKVDYIS